MSDQIPLKEQSSLPPNHSEAPFGHFAGNQEESGQQSALGPSEQDGQQNTQNTAPRSVAEMEKEAAALRALSAELDAILKLGEPATPQNPAGGEASADEISAKSIYIGSVDYDTTPVELQQHFSLCGTVERVTIMTNKTTGQPMGFAYLEFTAPEAANQAVATLNGSLFRGRELKVSLKRTNILGYTRGRGRGRGFMRGFQRGVPRGRAGFRGRGMFRGAGRFAPY